MHSLIKFRRNNMALLKSWFLTFVFIFVELLNFNCVNSVPVPGNSNLGIFSRGRSLFGNYELNTVDMIKTNYHPVETHVIETEDGYIIEIHRIPSKTSPQGNSTLKKLPVLLTHGVFQSSDVWVTNTPKNNALGYILHDEGYDVWLGNYRGNQYSRHKWRSPLFPPFWNFTFHEMGIYDLPATIDYILKVTGEKKLHVVALSMGPTVFLAGISLRPEYNEKIASTVLMGPCVFFDHLFNGMMSDLQFLSPLVGVYIEMFGPKALISPRLGKVLNNFLPGICNPKIDVTGVCQFWVNTVNGPRGEIATKERVPQLLATALESGASLKLLNHFLQLLGSHRFAEYDYGHWKNSRVYSRLTPPDYNLDLVTTPVAIFVGLNDVWAHVEDARTLERKLPNVIDFVISSHKDFGHLHFEYGQDMAVEMYDKAIDIFRRYDIA